MRSKVYLPVFTLMLAMNLVLCITVYPQVNVIRAEEDRHAVVKSRDPANLLPTATGANAAARDTSVAMATFTENQRAQIRDDIKKSLEEAHQNAKTNQIYDIIFKVALLLVTTCATIGSAYAGSFSAPDSPPRWLKWTNPSLTSIASLLSIFAFTQFNFPQRQSNWQIKAAALKSCLYTLDYDEPNKQEFLQRLGEIMTWDDFKQPTAPALRVCPKRGTNGFPTT